MLQSSKAHLKNTGESYAEHLRFAATVAFMAIGAGLACLIHAVVPALCQQSCSRTIGLLNRLFDRRDVLTEVAAEASGPMVLVGLLFLSAAVSAPLLVVTSGDWIAWALAGLSFAFPATFLLTNPQLDPV